MNLYYNPNTKYCIAVIGYARTLSQILESVAKISELQGVVMPDNSKVGVHYIHQSDRYKYCYTIRFPHDTRPSEDWFETIDERNMGL